MGSERAMLPGWASAQERYGPTDVAASEKEEGERAGKPRFKPIDREQLFWRMVNVERLIADDHAGRAIWEFVGKLNLSSYTGRFVRLRVWRGGLH